MHATTAIGGVTKSPLSERELADARDRVRRAELGIASRDTAGTAGAAPEARRVVPTGNARDSGRARRDPEKPATTAQHGDVGPSGDLVDELRRAARLTGRAGRLEACITAVTPSMERAQLDGIERMLAPSRRRAAQ